MQTCFTPTNPPKHTHTESRTNHLLDHWGINKPHLLYISLLLHSCLLSVSLFCFWLPLPQLYFLRPPPSLHLLSWILHLPISCLLSVSACFFLFNGILYSGLFFFFCWVTPSEFYRTISCITSGWQRGGQQVRGRSTLTADGADIPPLQLTLILCGGELAYRGQEEEPGRRVWQPEPVHLSVWTAAKTLRRHLGP